MFHVDKTVKPPIVIVRDMPLVKKYKKETEYIKCLKCHRASPKGTINCSCGQNLPANGRKRFKTKTLSKTRAEFPIRVDEPLAQIMIRAIVKHMQGEQPAIFLSPRTHQLRDRRWAYRILHDIGQRSSVSLWPDRLRSERACHLAISLKAESLLEWFSWEDWRTAKEYAKKGPVGLAKELGVQVVENVKIESFWNTCLKPSLTLLCCIVERKTRRYSVLFSRRVIKQRFRVNTYLRTQDSKAQRKTFEFMKTDQKKMEGYETDRP
jgi:hypothetical protein